ncbi:MAG: hypothetical protein FJZ00_12695, partial [Candidatus Sericytochromatia bacterium]|nr:hypothetical protein [Candidatus Tanganyikabacteria bacterium]
MLSAILGLALLIGLVHGTPLPPWVRLLHVHGALVGGVTQMILGGFLAMLSQPPRAGQTRPRAHLLPFVTINVGTAGMLMGFGFRHNLAVAVTGLLVIGASLHLGWIIWAHARQCPATPNRWYYTAAFLALLGGFACGEALALAPAQQSYGHVRLAHLHLGLLGFIILTGIGTVLGLLPAILKAAPATLRLTRPALIMMPLGVMLLIGGFMNSSV